MIQRIQSVWLILAAAASFITLKVAFFSGNILAPDNSKAFKQLNATSYLPILILTVMLIIIELIALFLYKNRKAQMQVTLVALFVSIINIVLYYVQAQKFIAGEGNYSLYAVAALVTPVFLILAARGIWRDQKLVKSLDRLR